MVRSEYRNEQYRMQQYARHHRSRETGPQVGVKPGGCDPLRGFRPGRSPHQAAPLNVAGAGAHGAKKSIERETFNGCAWSIGNPSATMSARANAKLAYFRVMDQFYACLCAHPIRAL